LSEPSTKRQAPSAVEYRYELVQDLRSQLEEEELRNRDRNAALLDIDREMSRYRKYLDLSPDEAQARAATASPAEKPILEHLASKGWGPAQIYYRLSPADLAALRAGRELVFSEAPRGGEQPLPPELARPVLTSLRDYRIVRRGDDYDAATVRTLPEGTPPAAVPGTRAVVTLRLNPNELGQLTLVGLAGFFLGTPPHAIGLMGDGERDLAVGVSPAVRNPQNAVANARFARDPGLQRRVTLSGVQAFGRSGGQADQRPRTNDERPTTNAQRPNARTPERPNASEKVTSADVLEALHRATGLNIIADYYTRLYPASAVAVEELPLFEALNKVGDTMRLRWIKEDAWIQFRSASYFGDRLKEVPNRLLARWAASRSQHQALTLDDLIEIAQLTDAQLDSGTMAEGARILYGLQEWGLARDAIARAHLRYLAGLSTVQRQEAQSAAGLAFNHLSLPQQQRFIALGLGSRAEGPQPGLEEWAGATLRVDYALPGEFQWGGSPPPGSPGRFNLAPPPVRAATREAALEAARRLDPRVDVGQVVPTELGLLISYNLSAAGRRFRPGGVYVSLHNVFMAPIQAE
jgi:hypothetical protein